MTGGISARRRKPIGNVRELNIRELHSVFPEVCQLLQENNSAELGYAVERPEAQLRVLKRLLEWQIEHKGVSIPRDVVDQEIRMTQHHRSSLNKLFGHVPLQPYIDKIRENEVINYRIITKVPDAMSNLADRRSDGLWNNALPWLAINHSMPRIESESVEPAFDKSLRQIASQALETLLQKGKPDARTLSFHVLKERGASANFRIDVSGVPTWLLRLHFRAQSPLYLNAVLKLQEMVARGEVFGKDSKYVAPLTSSSGRRYVEWKPLRTDQPFVQQYRLPFSARGSYFVTVQAFHPSVAEGRVQHYDGSSLDSLKSVANKYGRLQKFVQNHNSKLSSPEINQLNQVRRDLLPEQKSVKQFVDDFWTIEARAHDHLSSAPPEIQSFAQIWDNDKALVFSELKRVESDLSRNLSRRNRPASLKHQMLVLRDFHPHNCFCDRDTGLCSLVYDYEGFGTNWTHEEAVGFALHRITREYIRQVRSTAPVSDVGASVRIAVKGFLGAYKEEGPRLSENLKHSIGRQITLTTLLKLRRLSDRLFDTRRDQLGHSVAHFYGEAVKFVGLLKEACEYDRYLGNS